MRLFNTSLNLSYDSSNETLLFILSTLVFITLSPYFVWSNQLVILRISHLIGNTIILYIIIKHQNYKIFNITLALFFLIISIYTMVSGTEYRKFTYIPLLTILYITLRPNDQLRIFDYLVTILAIVNSIGLVSYLLSLLNLNIQLGEVIAPNPTKYPYAVFLGHIEEPYWPMFRFSSIFDEPGVVGTLNGLILSVIGISLRNYKSLIFLIAGLISFSLGFYIILIMIFLYNFNIKNFILIIFILVALSFLAENKFRELITARLAIENGRLSGDNRTSEVFDIYYENLIEKGGNDLIFGKGNVTSESIEELAYVSTYKMVIIRYGIIGASLILCFYALCVVHYNSTRKGWFLFFIFIISAYHRPDLLRFFSIVMFIGGLKYLKQNINST